MPSIFGTISVWLASVIPSMVGRVLGAVGIGVVTYTGVHAGMTELAETVRSAFEGGIGADILGLAALAGFGVYAKLVLSAYMGAVTFSIVSGALKKFAFGVSAEGG